MSNLKSDKPLSDSASPESVRESAARLYAALEAIQWGNDEIGIAGIVHHLCPECDRTELRGHQTDCSVGIALAKALPIRVPDEEDAPATKGLPGEQR